MPTIYEDIHGSEPQIEVIHSKFILHKYAKNKGAGQIDTSNYFSELWQAFAWAAIMGFHYGKRKPLTGEKVTHFKFSTINSNASDVFNSLILFAVAKESYSILKNASDVKKVIEEYANGGFEIISTILKEKGNEYFGFDASYLEEVMSRKETSITDTKANSSIKQDKKVDTAKVSTGTEFDI